jgi:glycine cleavage system regulatory protein
MPDVILTLLGADRPGLVESVADTIARLGGNWLESRMARLGGKFAGILRAQVPADRLAHLEEAMRGLARHDLKILVETDTAPSPPPAERILELELVGLDRPGIVRDISGALVTHGANVEEITTDCSSAPMSGEMLFRARIRATLPAGRDVGRLRTDLERFATDLMVELRTVEAVGGAARGNGPDSVGRRR